LGSRVGGFGGRAGFEFVGRECGLERRGFEGGCGVRAGRKYGAGAKRKKRGEALKSLFLGGKGD